ncbi:MAG: hypothetical protein FWF23_00245 [Alphaproteobacteria bacterium]|nr:hypothetical protein [Alphaproteobacteria bacterium]
MLDFDTVISKYGEIMIFHMIEDWEKHRGIRLEPISLEDRWARFIAETNDNLAPLQTVYA